MNILTKKNPTFFVGGGGLGRIFLYKLTRNPSLTFFFLRGGWLVYVHVQMFHMALLLVKANTCAKLF